MIWELSPLFIFSPFPSFYCLASGYNCSPKGWTDSNTLIKGCLSSLGIISVSKSVQATITYTLVSCWQLKLGQRFQDLQAFAECRLSFFFFPQVVADKFCTCARSCWKHSWVTVQANVFITYARYLVTTVFCTLLITEQKREAHYSFFQNTYTGE